ncbi:methyltransferase domain-containing protein [Streptomyces diacarni]|uniref:Methyltransferase domain-containing protein n=1 Tax=Streptomyces diacarni TaxID=2800381 RepID=A0A367ETP1_9ACTN|nr:methyltransferase domain-containing protein [Streptomyces diacarni]
MWLLRPPGVYAPQGDSELLLEALAGAPFPPGARMLDVCTGTGVVALAGARLGVREVHAVDISARAALAAAWNARLRGLPVRAHRGDFLERATGSFDLVTANPPYVPYAGSGQGFGRRARAWNAGRDGRRFVDRLCEAAPRLLADNGVLLMVHSQLCGPDRTLEMLRGSGLDAAVTARRTQPFGPVLRARARWLEQQELISPGQRHEELVVIRADLVPARERPEPEERSASRQP